MDPVPEIVWNVSLRIAGRLVEGIGEEALVGLYLHGSGAMGGWNAATSDVDLLGVVRRELTNQERDRVVEALTKDEFTVAGTGVEFSLVTTGSFEQLRPAPAFEVHVATGTGAKVVDGRGHPGDADLILHFSVCRERGIAVLGPPPLEVFPDVPSPMLLTALSAELDWAIENAPARYAVLNACRAWAFAEDSRLLSKVEGARWAVGRGIAAELVAWALDEQLGGPTMPNTEGLPGLVRAAQRACLAATGRA